MSKSLYACAHAAEFPVQALLRLRPELRAEPVAVLEGRAPLEAVCSLNRPARLKGAAPGMTRLEAEHISGLRLMARSAESEAAARAALLECAAHFSPRIEDVSPDASPAANMGTACACVLDIAGTERLFGPPETLARWLHASLAAAGFRAAIAVSANFHTARLKAAASHPNDQDLSLGAPASCGVTVIAAGQEAAALARLPIALLDLDEEHAETFASWGIGTLGELAALPETDLVARLGAQAGAWRELARGALPHTFQPIEAAFALEEVYDLDTPPYTPVDSADALLFVCARTIDCLAARAASRALALAALTVRMELEGGFVYRRTIQPAVPTIDRKFLLKLVQLEIAAHPPQAAVMRIALEAETGQSSKVQLGLFTPQMPEPSRLDVTIARLKAIAGAIAGEDRVGSPVLEDTHRPGSFRMESFGAAGGTTAPEAERPRAALRRIRPPVPVRVVLRASKSEAFHAGPTAFRAGERSYTVAAAYGPWRSNGCWWSARGWDDEEWDVLAQNGNLTVACLLVLDRTRNQWRIEAFYD
ncbi:MAG: DNA polymerase Y family protein [Terracidiphilus sp.]